MKDHGYDCRLRNLEIGRDGLGACTASRGVSGTLRVASTEARAGLGTRVEETMPHSVHSVSAEEPENLMDEDSILPDAPPAGLEFSESDDGQGNNSPNAVMQNAAKENIKLEDLFDDDDDEKFPSSGLSNETANSSPPATPP